MKKIILTLVMNYFVVFSLAQEGVTFQVEELSKPEKALDVKAYEEIYEELILKDYELRKWDVKDRKLKVQYDILAKSNAPDSLVSFGYHSFFNGMYTAYADHRPFVLSPDMMWLLISQGFARHIHSNPEKYRKYFVDFKGKTSLVVLSETDLLHETNPTRWEDVLNEFDSQMAKHTGKEIVDLLTANFSTTGITEKVASQINVMKAMEPYFEFVVLYIACGIPEITLQGNTEDWKKVLDKAQKLKKYDLAWWIDEIEPLLKEFINASEGKVNKKFWRNMFKYHTKKQYGAPNVIDGWIVKFFPYDKDGKRNNLKSLNGTSSLPEEMVKVDVKYIQTGNGQTTETMLELWSGFVGLKQDPKTFALTPQISWMVRKKDVNNSFLLQKIKSDNDSYKIQLRVDEVPEILKELKEINKLDLYFNKRVSIPEWLKNIPIKELSIYGDISQQEKEKILKWFDDSTVISINRELYKNGKPIDGIRIVP